MTLRKLGLLCVSNFPANTGYAWDFIEGLYAGIANRLAPAGVDTFVAYPAIGAPPAALRGSTAQPVELPIRLGDPRSLTGLLSFVRHNNIRVVYAADRPSWHPAYAALKMGGVWSVVIHDHTSGARSVPRGLKRIVKRARGKIPGMLADRVLGVSDFVVRRKIEVDLVPASRVARVWNSLPIPELNPCAGNNLRRAFGIAENRLIVVAACRATPEKGVAHLMRAFDQMTASASSSTAPILVYLGDGPAMGSLQELRDKMKRREDVVLAGYRPDAVDLVAGADICVVPSVWEEAFGLAALEPMARGIPVIATRVGGIPEVVEDGITGLLLPPANEEELSRALEELISNPDRRRMMGSRGRERAKRYFAFDDEIDVLAAILSAAFQLPYNNRALQ